MKSLLIVSRAAPWTGMAARETLDLALSGGAFDLPISLLWQDDGVYQLLADQQPAQLEQKDLQANIQALPLFGVEQLYVCAASLQQRQLEASALLPDIELLAGEQLKALLASHDQVLML